MMYVYEAEIEFDNKPDTLVYHARPAAKNITRQLENVVQFFIDQYRELGFKKLSVRRVTSL